MVKENPTTNAMNIVIPHNPNQSEERKELLKNLQSISQEDIEKIGSNVYLNLIIKDLQKGNFDNLDKDAALILINNNRYPLFLKRFNHFKWLDKEVAIALIDSGHIRDFTQNTNLFVWLDKEVATALIDNGCDIDLRDFIESDRKEIAFYAISKWKSIDLIHIMNISSDDDLEFAKQLISLNAIWCAKVVSLIEHSPNQIDKNYKKTIALHMINENHSNILLNNAKSFEWWLDKEVAIALIDNGCDIDLRDFIENDRKEIAFYAISKWKSINLIHIMNISSNDDLEFAKQLISLNENWCNQVVSLIKHSTNQIDRNYKKAIALHMINENHLDILLNNAKSFEWWLDKEVATALIDSGHIRSNIIPHFEWLDKEVAMALINHNYTTILYNNIGCFEWLDEEVYIELWKKGFEVKLDNLSKSDKRKFALSIVWSGKNINISAILNKIDSNDDLEFAKQLIRLNEIWCNLVIELIKNTTNKTYLNAIALEMINNNYIYEFLYIIDFFDKWLGSDVALAFINYDITQFIAYIGYFEWLNWKVVKALDDAWFHYIIDKHPECF